MGDRERDGETNRDRGGGIVISERGRVTEKEKKERSRIKMA